jgi:hypothetical protein
MMTRGITLFLLPLLLWSCGVSAKPELTGEEKARKAKAQSLFSEGCKRSGGFIRRTVASVEGLQLLKLRPTKYSPYDKNAVDPYGYDFDWGYKDKPPPYIGTFLIGKDENGHFQETKPTVTPGYRYVEVVDPKDGKRYRYTGAIQDVTHTSSLLIGGDGKTKFVTRDFVVEKELAVGKPPRYGVTFDDISTKEEREYWIAGSSLKVIDLETNEVIAERIGYMIDFSQGATPGGRQPWTFAKKNAGWSCPALKGQSYGARRFVENVLLIRDAQPVIPPDLLRQAAPGR